MLLAAENATIFTNIDIEKRLISLTRPKKLVVILETRF